TGRRVGTEGAAGRGGVRAPAPAAGLRSFYRRAPWLNAPDSLAVRPPLSASEAQAWAALVAVSGGLTLFSDNLPKLPPDRVPLLQRTVPVARVVGHPVDTAALPREG